MKGSDCSIISVVQQSSENNLFNLVDLLDVRFLLVNLYLFRTSKCFKVAKYRLIFSEHRIILSQIKSIFNVVLNNLYYMYIWCTLTVRKPSHHYSPYRLKTFNIFNRTPVLLSLVLFTCFHGNIRQQQMSCSLCNSFLFLDFVFCMHASCSYSIHGFIFL